MQHTIGERLKALRGNRSLTEMAELLGVSRARYSHWENNRRSPDLGMVADIAKTLGVSTDYLLGRTDDPRPLDVRAEETVDRQAIPLTPIPVLGVIHAGDPIPAEEHVIDWIAVPSSQAAKGRIFALRVKGDCMEPAKISDGDLVIVQHQSHAEEGEIAIVVWPDVSEAQLRRIYRKDGMVVLRADNPAWPPEIVKGGDLHILGIVVGVHTKPKRRA